MRKNRKTSASAKRKFLPESWRQMAYSYFLLFLLLLILATLSPAQTTPISSTNLAPTPPMGWATWNHFFCDYDEGTIRAQADALVQTGMRDLGYKYLIIQECIAPSRDANGVVVVDAKRFPHGMRPLIEYIHELGLKAGIYTDIGPHTCFDNPLYEGSYDHEEQDAATFASWGVDLIEVDYCNRPKDHSGKELYQRMAAAIQKTGRPMLLYICSWGNELPWEWAQGKAQLWRTDADVSWAKNKVEWNRVVQNFESNASHAVFNAPNSWNDPDMIEVGNPGLNMVEARSHFSMWAISAAPLWAGTDLTSMDTETRAIYTNPEVIAVNQDALGAGPVKVREQGAGLEVWDKVLAHIGSGNHAVMLLNLTSSAAKMSVLWSDLGLLPKTKVRDLWQRKDLGSIPEEYSTMVPAHGSVLLKVVGENDWRNGAVYEAEWPGNVTQGGTSLLECGECSSGYGITIGGQAGQPEGALVFPHITIAKAGNYTLALYFVRNGQSHKKTTLQVNDDSPVELKIGDYIWRWLEVPVSLKSGQNTLTIRVTGEDGLRVDKLRVIPTAAK